MRLFSSEGHSINWEKSCLWNFKLNYVLCVSYWIHNILETKYSAWWLFFPDLCSRIFVLQAKRTFFPWRTSPGKKFQVNKSLLGNAWPFGLGNKHLGKNVRRTNSGEQKVDMPKIYKNGKTWNLLDNQWIIVLKLRMSPVSFPALEKEYFWVIQKFGSGRVWDGHDTGWVRLGNLTTLSSSKGWKPWS